MSRFSLKFRDLVYCCRDSLPRVAHASGYELFSITQDEGEPGHGIHYTAAAYWQPFAEKLHRGDKQTSLDEMPRLTEEQFPAVVLQLCAQLQARLDVDVLRKHKQIAAAWWPVIMGDWYVIEELRQKLDQRLGPETTTPRTVTMDIIRSVSLDYMIEIG